MYVERETGGFARGRTIDGDAEKVRGIEKPSADTGPAADQKQLQKQFDEPAAQPVRLPAKLEPVSGLARPRSSRHRP